MTSRNLKNKGELTVFLFFLTSDKYRWVACSRQFSVPILFLKIDKSKYMQMNAYKISKQTLSCKLKSKLNKMRKWTGITNKL